MSPPQWVEAAGIWAREAATCPCAACGAPSRVILATEAHGPYSEPYCSVRCWGNHMDRTADIRGQEVTPRPWRGEVLPWNRVARLYSVTGPPGISSYRARNGDDVLTYRSPAGLLEGVLRRDEYGSLTVHVDPIRQHHGIGTRLVRAAARRWGVDLGMQRYTPAGLDLARRALPRDRNLEGEPTWMKNPS